MKIDALMISGLTRDALVDIVLRQDEELDRLRPLPAAARNFLARYPLADLPLASPEMDLRRVLECAVDQSRPYDPYR